MVPPLGDFFSDHLADPMLEATRLTRAGRLQDATALIQRALGIRFTQGFAGTRGAGAAPSAARVRIVPEQPASGWSPPGGAPLPEVILLPGPTAHPPRDATAPQPGAASEPAANVEAPERLFPVSEPYAPSRAGQFRRVTYTDSAGAYDYWIYVPTGYHGQPMPLLVMLHGCTQDAPDFAAGTRMNALAERHTLLVAYPEQSASANGSRCWNWFQPAHQRRDAGEPRLIANITRAAMRAYRVDPRRVFVAGLSAGGAMAAIMGHVYPDLFAAVGVHSGLARGTARNLPAALQAMRQGPPPDAAPAPGAGARSVPTIVFHGDRDGTVHAANADQVIAAASAPAGQLRVTTIRQLAPGGHAYTCTRYLDSAGRVVLEKWIVHQAGHAWSGGSAQGTFTDPRGPDASAEMLRFFLEHPR